MIVAIEGVDQSGKRTQTEMLTSSLQSDGIDTRMFEFPDYNTPAGRRIHDALHGGHASLKEIHQLQAENRRERADDIRDALKCNQVLIMNRYCDSNIVYGLANKMDREWLVSLDSDMPKADMVILLDIDAEESFRRKTRRDKFESNKDLIKMVVNLYRDEARNAGWIRVDGTREPDVIHAQILKIVHASLEGCN